MYFDTRHPTLTDIVNCKTVRLHFLTTRIIQIRNMSEEVTAVSISANIQESNKESDTECLKSTSECLTSQSLFSVKSSEVFAVDEVSNFTRNLVVNILSDCLNELSVLRSINLQNDLGLNPNKLLSYVSIEDRYMGQENHAEFRINSTNNNFDKLAKDINMIYVVLDETCKEIKKFGQYRCMENTVSVVNRMHEEEERLLQDESNQERIIADIKYKCEAERLDNISTIDETDTKIQELRYQAEDIYIYGQLEVQFFDKWEKTRIEQNTMKCQNNEEHFKSIISSTKEIINVEKRCHNELDSYFEETKSDYLQKIQQWMQKYDEEIEQREGDIIHLRSDLEKITDERKLLCEKYEKQQVEINNWLEYKRIKEENEGQRLREIDAATKIEAWWRGVMVRNKLGPYDKKKKGKLQSRYNKKLKNARN
uniref:Dynein regulatory complex protein 9 n=1 Tax=Dendroctonus ponderosae TaxID=77166 RepID=A0AAR5PMW4_DENPD